MLVFSKDKELGDSSNRLLMKRLELKRIVSILPAILPLMIVAKLK